MVKERYWQSTGSGPKLLIREKEAKMNRARLGNLASEPAWEAPADGEDPRTGKQRLTGKMVSIPDSGYQVNIPIDKSQFTLEFPLAMKDRTSSSAPNIPCPSRWKEIALVFVASAAVDTHLTLQD